MDRELELELVARLRQGDAAAFDAVYAAYNRRLFAFVARLARSRHIAEDLVEETWLRLVRQARRLQADTRLAPSRIGDRAAPAHLPRGAAARGR